MGFSPRRTYRHGVAQQFLEEIEVLFEIFEHLDPIGDDGVVARDFLGEIFGDLQPTVDFLARTRDVELAR